MTAPLLETRGVQRFFGGRGGWLKNARPPVRAVDGVDLRVSEGSTLGIVGESGCGKSTLARMLVGLDAPTEGEIRFQDKPLQDLLARDFGAVRRNLQFIFQDPVGSLNPRKTVRKILETPLKHLRGLSGAEREEEIHALMDQVRLRPEFADRYPHEFSGGQAQRIGIARALAARPRVLVLDEPVSALDVSVQAGVLRLLGELKAELELTYVFISHDLAVVEILCDRVAVMYLGRIMELAPRAGLFRRPRHPYTRLLLESIPRPGRGLREVPAESGEPPDPADPPPGCPFEPRCPERRDRCADERPEMEMRGGGWETACFFPLE